MCTRTLCSLKVPIFETVRLLLCSTGDEVRLYGYDTAEDGPCTQDWWFSSKQDAIVYCTEKYAVQPSDWGVLPDLPLGCQHDWILPTRRVVDGHDAATTERYEPVLPVSASQMNDRKWEALRVAMYELGNVKPAWKTKSHETGYITSYWDKEWYHHFRDGPYSDIQWAHIKIEAAYQRAAVLAWLQYIGIPYNEINGGLEIVGTTA